MGTGVVGSIPGADLMNASCLTNLFFLINDLLYSYRQPEKNT
jgi:hypothetical protein